MAKDRKYKYFSCDFETTVYEGQVNTEVWASACVELYTEDVKIFGSIDETFLWFLRLKVLREGLIGGVNKNEKTDEKKYYIFKCIYFLFD